MKALAIVLGIIIIVLLAVLIFYPGPAKQGPTAPVLQPVMSSDGHLAVASLHAGDLIASPLTVTGTVTGGGWFYQATFPVKVVDSDGIELGVAAAEAQANWISTGTVPFTAIIQFSVPQDATGAVVFSDNNPSGTSQDNLSLSIPVRFR